MPWPEVPEQTAVVAGRIDWKYALGLDLTCPGFDHSVLNKFRSRLVDNELSRLCFDKVLGRRRELRLIKDSGKQRIDSTKIPQGPGARLMTIEEFAEYLTVTPR